MPVGACRNAVASGTIAAGRRLLPNDTLHRDAVSLHLLLIFLKFEQEFAVLRILNATLFFQQTLLVLITLQFLYVFYGGLEDGALVLPNVPDDIVILIMLFGKERAQFFDAIIDIEPSPPFN
jgi:hypothetical protein